MTEYNINSQWTLLERAKRTADGKTILPIIDVMDELGVPDFLRDVPWFEANRGLEHVVRRTVSRPASTRRSFYGGVTSTITTTQMVHEPVILLEQRSEIDEDHADTLTNPNELRRQEDQGHIKGIQEDTVYEFFRGARTSGSEYINGFQTRIATLSYPGGSTTSLPYCWDGGSAVTCTSIYIIEWGPRANFGIYPVGNVKNTILGISVRNKGKEKITESASSLAVYYGYVTQFKRWVGLGCADDRKVTRIANINSTVGGSDTLDEDILIQALNHGRFDKRRTRIYCNPYIKSQIDIRAKDKGNVQWSIRDVFGRPIPTFWDIPVRVLDETILSADETAVT